MSSNTIPLKKKPPFFIVGYSRSGSTLFRHILNVHPNLAVIEEPMYWLNYYENIDIFGDLNDDKNIIKLLNSISSHERFKSHDLNIVIDQKLINKIQPRTYSNVIDVLFSIYAEKYGKLRWGVDNPMDIYKIPEILELFPNAQLIFLIRDVRAILTSTILLTGDPKFNYYKAGLRWIQAIDIFKENISNLSNDRWLIVRYEDLVSSPEITLKKVCHFLDEPYSERLINYHIYAQDDVKHAKSELYLKPISAKAINRWKNILDKKEIERLESVVGKYLEEFNYKPVTNYKAFKEKFFSKSLYFFYHNLRIIFDILFFLKIRNRKLKKNKKLFYIRLFLTLTKKINISYIKKLRLKYLKTAL